MALKAYIDKPQVKGFKAVWIEFKDSSTDTLSAMVFAEKVGTWKTKSYTHALYLEVGSPAKCYDIAWPTDNPSNKHLSRTFAEVTPDVA